MQVDVIHSPRTLATVLGVSHMTLQRYLDEKLIPYSVYGADSRKAFTPAQTDAITREFKARGLAGLRSGALVPRG